MAWRVLRDGAMVEISNGVIQVAGRDLEQTTVVIARENQIIEQELSKSMVDRYDAGDDYIRSTVERVSVTYDDDGNQVVTPVGEPDAEPAGDLTDEEAAARVTAAETAQAEAEGNLTAANERISALESELSTAESDLDTAKQEVERLSADLTAANDQLGTAISYADLSKEALAVEAQQQNITVTRSDGKEGDPLKSDYVTALEGASSGS